MSTNGDNGENGELTQSRKKIWAGLKRAVTDLSEIRGDIEELEATVGEYDDFEMVIEESDSFQELEDQLIEDGWDVEEAENFTQRIENNYEDYEEFEESVTAYESYEELETDFSDETSIDTGDGTTPRAVIVHENGGVGVNGQEIPPGGVEVIGTEIHFSRGQLGSGTAGFSVSSFDIDGVDDSNTTDNGQTVTFSAEVTNTSATSGSLSVSLTEDGRIVESTDVYVLPDDTIAVWFDRTGEDECHEYAIEGQGGETVCWVHPSIVQ